MKLTNKEEKDIRKEIQHIIDSGANTERLVDSFNLLLSRRDKGIISRINTEEWIRRTGLDCPYPSDIFLEPNEKDWSTTRAILKDNGLSLDRVFAKFGRKVWQNAIDSMKRNSEIF